MRKEGGRIDGIFTTGQNDHFLERNESSRARARSHAEIQGGEGEGVRRGWVEKFRQ